MGRRGRVRIGVGFTIACVFGSYHHLNCEFYNEHYVEMNTEHINFISACDKNVTIS
jgi:hypothetical protein